MRQNDGLEMAKDMETHISLPAHTALFTLRSIKDGGSDSEKFSSDHRRAQCVVISRQYTIYIKFRLMRKSQLLFLISHLNHP